MTYSPKCRDVAAVVLLFAASISAQRPDADRVSQGIGRAAQDAPLFAAPSTSSQRLRTVKRNDPLSLVNSEGGWFKVTLLDTKTFSEIPGFIEARFVSVLAPISAPPPRDQPLSMALPDHGGVRLLDEASYASAIADGNTKKAEDLGNSPMVLRMRATNDPSTSEGPFFFTIQTPYTRVAQFVAVAKERYETRQPPSLAAANAGLVEIVVGPRTRSFTTMQSIERVVLKRGVAVIEAAKSVVTPRAYSNALGGSRQVNNGVFTFAFEPFAPTGQLTIVFIGSGRPFEWTMGPEELAALR